MNKTEVIKISEKQVITEIKTIQSYIEEKKIKATETEVVWACIRLAKRLGAEKWSIYLEVKHMHELKEEKEKSDIYKGLLKHVVDADITLDVLNYINGLGDEEKVDAQKISDGLGYKKEKVEEVIAEIFRRSQGKNE